MSRILRTCTQPVDGGLHYRRASRGRKEVSIEAGILAEERRSIEKALEAGKRYV
jgi:hypothetical protein